MFLLWGKYVRKYYPRFVIFFLIGLAALVTVDIFQLRIPEVVGGLVDKLSKDGTIDVQSQYFISTIIEVVVVAFVLFIGRILWRLSLFYASKRIEENLRKEMFLKAEQLDVTYYHNNKVGNIMSWATDDLETLQEFLGWGSLMVIDGTFLTVLALTKMFILNTSLATIALIPILLIALAGALCERHMSYRWRLRQESNDSLYDFSQESFTGIRVIKAFVKEKQQIHNFRKLAEKNRDANVKFTFISVFFDVLIEVIIALVAAIILGFGGWFVYGTITGSPINIFGVDIILEAGPLVTFQGYFYSLVWPMIALGQVITMFSKARTSYRRVANFLDLPLELKDSENVVDKKIEGNISFKHFSFKYKGALKNALTDITLDIKKGEMIGVVGTVGSGKSTLVNTLARLYNVESGTIYLDDEDTMNISLSSLRDAFAISPQDNFLFSGSIKENITFSDEEYDEEKFFAALVNSDVKKDIDNFENKEDTFLAENGATISGGQKQRISLARAFYKDSPILILDDVVSAVDVKTEKNILKNLKKAREGKTTIIVASRVSTVMGMDKVIVLNKGNLEAFDSPKNLLKTSDTFSRMVLLQKLSSGKEETVNG